MFGKAMCESDVEMAASKVRSKEVPKQKNDTELDRYLEENRRYASLQVGAHLGRRTANDLSDLERSKFKIPRNFLSLSFGN